MYAAVRQGKTKAGMAEELTRRIKEGAIPIIYATNTTEYVLRRCRFWSRIRLDPEGRLGTKQY